MPRPSFDVRHREAGDVAACDAILAAGSKSFHTASRLLPTRIREPIAALYAFCRVADDEVDLAEDPRRRLVRLRARLDDAYRGMPAAHPVDRAFADVVAAFHIPRAVPDALIEGLAWDVEGRPTGSIEDLEAYAVRVAGTVGVMTTLIMGVRDGVALARACDLGVAMQFTNIARDVGEDARNGRLYLPRAWLIEEGVDPDAFLARPRYDAGVCTCVLRLLTAAERLYARGASGVALLPADCRGAIRAAAAIYAEIGRRIVDEALDPVSERTVVSTLRKLRLAVDAWIPTMDAARPDETPPLEAARFLVEAVEAMPVRQATPRRLTGSYASRTEWVLDLFHDLDRRERGLDPRAAQ